MTNVTIALSDHEAAALRAKAAQQGLTLETWLKAIAEKEVSPAAAPARPANVIDRMRQIRSRVKPDPEGWTVRDYINYGRR